MLYGATTFVGLAFSDLSDIFISSTFIVGSAWVVQVLNAVDMKNCRSLFRTSSCASSGHSTAPAGISKSSFMQLMRVSIVLKGGRVSVLFLH